MNGNRLGTYMHSGSLRPPEMPCANRQRQATWLRPQGLEAVLGLTMSIKEKAILSFSCGALRFPVVPSG